jgi:hypothetical protein
MLAQHAFPAWLLSFLLIALLGYLSWTMTQKALQLRAGEEARRAEQQSPEASQVHA